MTAFNSFVDPLAVYVDQLIAGPEQGINIYDNRLIWHGLGDITFDDGGLSGTQWFQDNGPKGIQAFYLEPRAYCSKGGCHFTFTGRDLVLRLNIAYAWFETATLTIDGVAVTASSLDGLAIAHPCSCHAGDYPVEWEEKGYLDLLVASGLADTSHSVVITVNNSDAAKFWSISGFKVGVTTSLPLAQGPQYFLPPYVYNRNRFAVEIKNRNPTRPIFEPKIVFPVGIMDEATATNPAPDLTQASLEPYAVFYSLVYPVWDGSETSGTHSMDLTLSGYYYDAAGAVPIEVSYPITDLYAYATGTWSFDTLTPDGRQRTYTDQAPPGNYIHFTFVGDKLDLVYQTSLGWGTIGLYASNNSTLLQSVSCNVDSADLHTVSWTGFGVGNHDVYLRKTVNDGTFIVPCTVTWYITQPHTLVTETVTLNFDAHQPYAMPPDGQDMPTGGYDLTYYQPNVGEFNYDTPIAYNNEHLAYSEVLTRFPTFAVCYQGGYRDTLAGYDILIVDPLAAHADDVIYWQSLGIKVFGYVASGEEVGFYSDRYDFTSALDANKDGTGPNGYASYYMFTRDPTGLTGPDKNGVWASYYVNPDFAYGWPTRLAEYYAPQLFGGPLDVVEETVTVANHLGNKVFDTAYSPIDLDVDITLTTTDHVTTFVTYRDFVLDPKTGAFVLNATAATAAVAFGQDLLISYRRKGHYMDGVFWDVVDTPDVYSGPDFGYEYVPGYAEKFALMLNEFKTGNITKMMISNRGFTILPDIIRSCSGVMFESWLTYPLNIADLANTDYARITDPASVEYNDAINQQLRDLREIAEFDVYSLNYARPDDIALQEYCRTEDSKRGYLSWQTTITLTTPAHNTTIDTPAVPIVTNEFRRYKIRNWTF